MTLQYLKALSRCFNGFPRDYLVLDTETTGTDKAKDLIAQLGYCLVLDGVPVETVGIHLNWTDPGLVDQAWLQQRLRNTREQVEFRGGVPTGRVYRVRYDTLREQGLPPAEALNQFHALLLDLRAAGYPFVAHNGYNFDNPFIENHFRRWLGVSFQFGPNEMWDTGMIEKASQLNDLPDRSDTLRSFALRVGGVRAKGVYWNLDGHCDQKYRLAERHGLDVREAHDAGFDCLLTHYLFEEFQRLAATENRQEGAPASDV